MKQKQFPVMAMVAIVTCVLVVAGCDSCDGNDDWTGLDATVSFVPLAASFPSATINFSPSAALPARVTYILRDNRTPQNSWNSASGFNGQVNVSNYANVNGDVTFTQTFYLNGVEITGANSKRTVVVNVVHVSYTEFNNITSNTGSVTLKWP